MKHFRRALTATAVAALAATSLTMSATQTSQLSTAQADGSSSAAANGPFKSLVPYPNETALKPGAGFTLSPQSRIHGDQLSATYLRSELRPATGFGLPISTRPPQAGDIVLTLSRDDILPDEASAEGYRITVGPTVVIEAETRAGLFYGTQTLKQLLPGWIASRHAVQVNWTIPAATIIDHPRFGYRGLMLDLSRAYLSPSQIRSTIDQMASLKLNRLHLHLSDDPAWRIAINQPKNNPSGIDYSQLIRVGSKGGNIQNVDPKDPHPYYYSVADYVALVRYAESRFVEIVPEIDGPAHSTSALASIPQLNASGTRAPIFVPTDGKRTYFDPNLATTTEFLTHVFSELGTMSGQSEFLHVGGDEAFGMPETDYVKYLSIVRTASAKAGKTPIFWNEASPYAGKGDVIQHWIGGLGDTVAAAERGAKVIMSPSDRAYLDMTYPSGAPRNIGAPNYGCGANCNWMNAYTWNPVQGGLTADQVLGVESTIWGYSYDTSNFLLFQRLGANAEVAWTNESVKDVTSFGQRIGQHSIRWASADINFQTATDIDWADGVAAAVVCTNDGDLTGEVIGWAVAEQSQTKMVQVMVDYGDGSTPLPAALIAPYEQTEARTHGLLSVLGDHEYSSKGIFEGSMTFQRTSAGTPERMPFRVKVGGC